MFFFFIFHNQRRLKKMILTFTRIVISVILFVIQKKKKKRLRIHLAWDTSHEATTHINCIRSYYFYESIITCLLSKCESRISQIFRNSVLCYNMCLQSQ